MEIDSFSQEDEIQALIVLGELTDPIETPNNNFYSFYPKSIEQAQTYFRRFALDLTEALESLAHSSLAYADGSQWHLTDRGLQAARCLRRQRPPIWYWYRDFYTAVEHSRAFSRYCEEVYGQDLSQHGFSDMDELQWLLDIVVLNHRMQVLDIGCGNGQIAEYVSDTTGASVTGIDYIPEAIAHGNSRTTGKRNRLRFEVMNIDELDEEGARYDVILSIDSIFFGEDLTTTLANLARLLRPNGAMALFCGEDLSRALKHNRLTYTIHDRSREHHRHLKTKRAVGVTLRADFEAEGNLFIWENIMAESLDEHVRYDPANCPRPRYLYHVSAF